MEAQLGCCWFQRCSSSSSINQAISMLMLRKHPTSTFFSPWPCVPPSTLMPTASIQSAWSGTSQENNPNSNKNQRNLMPAQRGIILHSHVDTATLRFSRELTVYRHHLRLTLVPWIFLRNVLDMLLQCRCLWCPCGTRQMQLAAMPSPSCLGALERGSHFFTSWWGWRGWKILPQK